VLERELADAPVDPRPLHLHRPPRRPEHRDHRRDRVVVDRDPRDLRQHRSLPDRVGDAGLAPPRLARIDVELAVAAIAERSVVADSEATDALE
jgi:hypothetical protein